MTDFKDILIKYMEELEVELSSMPGYKEPENVKKEKESLKSRTDPECGYIYQARKKGMGYLTEMTVDTSHGIITGVNCYPETGGKVILSIRKLD